MSIWVHEGSKVLVQGITGSQGTFHATRMVEYGTDIVGGVTPGKGGQMVDLPGRSVPVYGSMTEAVLDTGADVSVIYVPARFAASAIIEAAEAFHDINGSGLIVCITEGIPTLDMVRSIGHLAGKPGVRLIGPNIKAVTSQLTFKMRGNAMPFAWHQDNVYGELDPYNAISCLTALDDADVENGCLRLIPGSHKDGQANYQHTNEDRGARRPVELEVDDRRGIPLPMKAGECLFFHCHMLHHSEGNRAKDRDRRLMLFRYADADAVEVYNDRRPRLGRLLRGRTLFPEVEAFEANLPLHG